MSGELKPCPNCGSRVTVESAGPTGALIVLICEEGSPCRGSGLGVYIDASKKEQAFEAWNRRASPPAPSGSAWGVKPLIAVPASITDEQVAAALKSSLDFMAECGVNSLSPFDEYPSPAETIRRAYAAMTAGAPTVPEEWWPVSCAPANTWVRTKREGETGENVCSLHRIPEQHGGGEEWVERDTGVTTITHGSFAAPTHWRPLTLGSVALTPAPSYAEGVEAAVMPVAWMKYWAQDGQERSRVDLRPDHEPWLTALNPIVIPLYASQQPGMETALWLAADILNDMVERGAINTDPSSSFGYFVEEGALKSIGVALPASSPVAVVPTPQEPDLEGIRCQSCGDIIKNGQCECTEPWPDKPAPPNAKVAL